jgi:hypothetical protein
MLIRHAEKPDEAAKIKGVTPNGDSDPEELTVRGWQRAGALIGMFVREGGNSALHGLTAPTAIFASGVQHHSKSLRPQHAVAALAEKVGLQVNTAHLKGDEVALVADILRQDGIVLVAWEHEAIPQIANLIAGNETICPQSWPGERFDVVWVFERSDDGSNWSFLQVGSPVSSSRGAQTHGFDSAASGRGMKGNLRS